MMLQWHQITPTMTLDFTSHLLLGEEPELHHVSNRYAKIKRPNSDVKAKHRRGSVNSVNVPLTTCPRRAGSFSSVFARTKKHAHTPGSPHMMESVNLPGGKH